MEGLKLDDVLTGLAFEGDRCVCRLVDLGLKAEFRLRFDRNFRELVVYTPAASGTSSRSSRTPRRPTRSTCKPRGSTPAFACSGTAPRTRCGS